MEVKINGTKEYCKAKLTVTNEHVLILNKGAILGPVRQKSLRSWMKIRETLKVEGNVLQQDLECSSISMAAAIVTGHNQNGWTIWKNSKNEFIDVYRNGVDDE